MANQKISQLTDGSPVQATDQFPINRAGANFRISGLAPTVSPALTGVPTTPTAAAGDNTTQIATNQFVQSALASLFQVATVTLTPTQIKNLDNTAATSVTLVAAPGAGKQIFYAGNDSNLQFATTPYATSAGNLNISYSDGATLTVIFAGVGNSAFITAGASRYITGGPFNLVAGSALSTNQALVVSLNSATKYTAGDSPIVLSILYRVLSVS